MNKYCGPPSGPASVAGHADLFEAMTAYEVSSSDSLSRSDKL